MVIFDFAEDNILYEYSPIASRFSITTAWFKRNSMKTSPQKYHVTILGGRDFLKDFKLQVDNAYTAHESELTLHRVRLDINLILTAIYRFSTTRLQKS